MAATVFSRLIASVKVGAKPPPLLPSVNDLLNREAPTTTGPQESGTHADVWTNVLNHQTQPTLQPTQGPLRSGQTGGIPPGERTSPIPFTTRFSNAAKAAIQSIQSVHLTVTPKDISKAPEAIPEEEAVYAGNHDPIYQDGEGGENIYKDGGGENIYEPIGKGSGKKQTNEPPPTPPRSPTSCASSPTWGHPPSPTWGTPPSPTWGTPPSPTSNQDTRPPAVPPFGPLSAAYDYSVPSEYEAPPGGDTPGGYDVPPLAWPVCSPSRKSVILANVDDPDELIVPGIISEGVAQNPSYMTHGYAVPGPKNVSDTSTHYATPKSTSTSHIYDTLGPSYVVMDGVKNAPQDADDSKDQSYEDMGGSPPSPPRDSRPKSLGDKPEDERKYENHLGNRNIALEIHNQESYGNIPGTPSQASYANIPGTQVHVRPAITSMPDPNYYEPVGPGLAAQREAEREGGHDNTSPPPPIEASKTEHAVVLPYQAEPTAAGATASAAGATAGLSTTHPQSTVQQSQSQSTVQQSHPQSTTRSVLRTHDSRGRRVVSSKAHKSMHGNRRSKIGTTSRAGTIKAGTIKAGTTRAGTTRAGTIKAPTNARRKRPVPAPRARNAKKDPVSTQRDPVSTEIPYPAPKEVSKPSPEVSPDKPSSHKPSPGKVSPDKLSPDKLSPDKLSPDEPSPDKPSPDKQSPDKLSSHKLSPEVLPNKPSSHKLSPEVSPVKLSPGKVSPGKPSPDNKVSPEVSPDNKVSLEVSSHKPSGLLAPGKVSPEVSSENKVPSLSPNKGRPVIRPKPAIPPKPKSDVPSNTATGASPVQTRPSNTAAPPVQTPPSHEAKVNTPSEARLRNEVDAPPKVNVVKGSQSDIIQAKSQSNINEKVRNGGARTNDMKTNRGTHKRASNKRASNIDSNIDLNEANIRKGKQANEDLNEANIRKGNEANDPNNGIKRKGGRKPPPNPKPHNLQKKGTQPNISKVVARSVQT